MKRYGLMLVLAALLVGLSVTAFAQGPWCWGGRNEGDNPRSGRGPGCMFTDIQTKDLTDAQRTQLQKIDEDFLKKTDPIRDEMRQKHQDLRSLLNSPKPDEAKIWEKQKEISALRDRMDRERIQYSLEITKVVPGAQVGGKDGKYPCGNRFSDSDRPHRCWQ